MWSGCGRAASDPPGARRQAVTDAAADRGWTTSRRSLRSSRRAALQDMRRRIGVGTWQEPARGGLPHHRGSDAAQRAPPCCTPVQAPLSASHPLRCGGLGHHGRPIARRRPARPPPAFHGRGRGCVRAARPFRPLWSGTPVTPPARSVLDAALDLRRSGTSTRCSAGPSSGPSVTVDRARDELEGGPSRIAPASSGDGGPHRWLPLRRPSPSCVRLFAPSDLPLPELNAPVITARPEVRRWLWRALGEGRRGGRPDIPPRALEWRADLRRQNAVQSQASCCCASPPGGSGPSPPPSSRRSGTSSAARPTA